MYWNGLSDDLSPLRVGITTETSIREKKGKMLIPNGTVTAPARFKEYEITIDLYLTQSTTSLID